jgi:hypothetical protein
VKVGGVEVTPQQWLAVSAHVARTISAWNAALQQVNDILGGGARQVARLSVEMQRQGWTAERIRKLQRRETVADRRVAHQLAVRDRRRARNAARARRRP